MNQLVLIGRLTKDPELRFIPNGGKAVARFSIAVNKEYSKEKEADFFNVVVWGKPAENCANYLKKGRLVAINGSIHNNNYEDKNGVKHYTMEVNANRVEFLEWADDTQKQAPQKQEPTSQNDFKGFQAIDGDDDIPF